MKDQAANWITAIAEGDEAAFKQLYEHFSDRVFNTIISYTQNEEDAEELLQDVFVTTFQQAPSFKNESSVSTWIYRIAVNKSLDFLRNKKAQKRGGIFASLYKKGEGDLAIDPPNFVHPGALLEDQENAELLFSVIKSLPEQQQTAFILTQIEGLPQKEVAGIMRTTPKAVDSLLQRAKARLRKDLEKLYPERGKRN